VYPNGFGDGAPDVAVSAMETVHPLVVKLSDSAESSRKLPTTGLAHHQRLSVVQIASSEAVVPDPCVLGGHGTDR